MCDPRSPNPLKGTLCEATNTKQIENAVLLYHYSTVVFRNNKVLFLHLRVRVRVIVRVRLGPHVSPKGNLIGQKWRCINAPALAHLTLTTNRTPYYELPNTIYSEIQHMFIYILKR